VRGSSRLRPTSGTPLTPDPSRLAAPLTPALAYRRGEDESARTATPSCWSLPLPGSHSVQVGLSARTRVCNEPLFVRTSLRGLFEGVCFRATRLLLGALGLCATCAAQLAWLVVAQLSPSSRADTSSSVCAASLPGALVSKTLGRFADAAESADPGRLRRRPPVDLLSVPRQAELVFRALLLSSHLAYSLAEPDSMSRYDYWRVSHIHSPETKLSRLRTWLAQWYPERAQVLGFFLERWSELLPNERQHLVDDALTAFCESLTGNLDSTPVRSSSSRCRARPS